MLLLPLLLAPAGEAVAQVWHQERDNGIQNVQSGSSSPVFLYYNPTKDWKAASASWNYEKGDFHRPASPAGKSELDLCVEELGSIGKIRTSGGLRYRNTRDIARNWNSLIGNDPDNLRKKYCNLNSTEVTVSLGENGRVFGSLFGGGSDAHTLGDTHVKLLSGTIGTVPYSSMEMRRAKSTFTLVGGTPCMPKSGATATKLATRIRISRKYSRSP